MRIAVTIATVALLAGCGGEAGGQEEARRATPAPAGEAPQGGGEARTYALTGFTAVALRGPDDVDVRVGEDFSIRATGDPAILDTLEIELVGDELRIGREGEWLQWDHSDAEGRVAVSVTMPSLRAASLAGSGDLTIDRAEAESFEASLAGSGNLVIGELRASESEFDVAGSGNIRAAGVSPEVEVGIAGSGDVDIAELRAERLEAEIAGSGNVEAYATRTARASFLGSGDVRVRGGAECRSDALGSGELHCE